MAWLEVNFQTDFANAESFCDALLVAGALSTSVEDAEADTRAERAQYSEPGSNAELTIAKGWRQAKISALFAPDVDANKLVSHVSRELGILPAPGCTLHPVEEEDWVTVTQKQFSPLRISERLWICPSWCEPPVKNAINLRIDPGMAFGVGSHPSTLLCLQWLNKHASPGLSMLDYGCGSGVLAIAAARLGCAPVVAADIDQQALQTAQRNASDNEVEIRFMDVTDSDENKSPRYDLVVANILANPLKALAPVLAACLSARGRLALSGILDTQAEELIACYSPWVRLQVINECDGWVCLSSPDKQMEGN